MRNELRFPRIQGMAADEIPIPATWGADFSAGNVIYGFLPTSCIQPIVGIFKRRNRMKHHTTAVRVAFVVAAFLLLISESVSAQKPPEASGAATFTVKALGKQEETP